MKLDVLVIAAHRDDAEITSGGFLIKMHDLGYKTGVLDFTRGEMGTKGTADDREREAETAANAMGLSIRENLGLPDAGVAFARENVLKVVGVLRRLRPHLVVLPYWEHRHPDHTHCCQIGKEACYFSGLKKLDSDGEPHRPHKILYSTYYRDVRASFVVDISNQFDRKLEAVSCYGSQFDRTPESKQIFSPGIDIFEFLRTRDRAYGIQIRRQYGEPYVVSEMIEIDDPMKMTVPSV
jgi:bacillithiol biosynthesis deacetylase BshB1